MEARAAWPVSTILLTDELQVFVLVSLKVIMGSSKNGMWINSAGYVLRTCEPIIVIMIHYHQPKLLDYGSHTYHTVKHIASHILVYKELQKQMNNNYFKVHFVKECLYS